MKIVVLKAIGTIAAFNLKDLSVFKPPDCLSLVMRKAGTVPEKRVSSVAVRQYRHLFDLVKAM